jgi:aspartate 1-decarboxylase
MQIQVLKSKIHRVRVTGADLNYSITIDETLLRLQISLGEKFQ